MYKFIIQRFAQIDLDEAFIWYEEKTAGLGFKLIEDFDVTANKIITNPFYTTKITNELRAASLTIFPYEIVYVIEPNTYTISVIAFSHFKRKPIWYKLRK